MAKTTRFSITRAPTSPGAAGQILLDEGDGSGARDALPAIRLARLHARPQPDVHSPSTSVQIGSDHRGPARARGGSRRAPPAPLASTTSCLRSHSWDPAQ